MPEKVCFDTDPVIVNGYTNNAGIFKLQIKNKQIYTGEAGVRRHIYQILCKGCETVRQNHHACIYG